MIAFDADVLSEVFQGNANYLARASAIPAAEQAVPVVVAEEVLRGRLSMIRLAESGKSRIGIDRAYQLLQDSILNLQHFLILPNSPDAEAVFQSWRKQKIRGTTHDLRIAEICVVHSVKLVTRNQSDFELIPGLDVEFWN